MSPAVDVPIALSPNIAELLWRRAAAHEGDAAIAMRDTSVSYAGLMARAAAFAVELRARHVAPGDRVGVFLEHGPDSAAAFFGTVAAGAVAVMLPDTLRPRQIEQVCRSTSVGLLISSADLIARQSRAIAPEIPQLDPYDVPIANDVTPVPRVATDVAQLLYAPGSSGAAKAVAVTHANLWAGVQSVAACVGLESTDRIAGLLPFSLDYGLSQLLCALWSGGALVGEPGRTPDEIVARLREAGATVLAAVPSLWMQLLGTHAFNEPIASLRIMTNTGGGLPVGAVRRMRASQPQARLYLMYGLAEAFRATYLPPEDVDRYPDSIGRAVPGADIMVLRDDGSPCDTNEVGELVQRGPTVALGYWNDPAATAATYRANPARAAGSPDTERVVFSGSLVRRDESGRLFLVGRRDALIESLGQLVSPDEVANALYASGEVIEAVVTGEPDGMGGEQIVAVVRLSPGGSVARLRAFCRAELPRHMLPARYQVEEYLPCAPSGEYDVGAIRAHLAASARE